MWKKTGAFIESFINSILILLLSVMTIIVFLNVVLRYVFDAGITWSEELSRYAFLYLIFIGSIISLKDDKHLRIDILEQKVGGLAKKILVCIQCLGCLYLLYLVLAGSMEIFSLNNQNASAALSIPYPVYIAPAFIGSVGMGLVLIRKLFKTLIPQGSALDNVKVNKLMQIGPPC